jgi:hypothetical protein
MSPLLKPWAVEETTASVALVTAVVVLTAEKAAAMLKRLPVGTCAMVVPSQGLSPDKKTPGLGIKKPHDIAVVRLLISLSGTKKPAEAGSLVLVVWAI